MDAIFHTATVMNLMGDADCRWFIRVRGRSDLYNNPLAIVKPAVAGTVGVLESVKAHG